MNAIRTIHHLLLASGLFASIAGFQACGSKAAGADDALVAPMTELPFTALSLEGMDAFQPVQGKGWQVCKSVYMDRNNPASSVVEKGSGVLLNLTDSSAGAVLTTKLEHGDLDLHLDVQLSKGAEGVLWLQGRYGILLKDSWMESAQAGAVLLANNTIAAPSSNACKAPGLWQQLYLRFRAAQKDSSGKEIKPAQLLELSLNGTTVQKDLVLTAPAAGALINSKRAAGPLVFKGTKGSLAYRNIRYKTYGADAIALSTMKYAVYKGVYKNKDTLSNFEPIRTGTTDTLSWMIGDRKAQLVIEGEMNVPVAGQYLFRIKGGGPMWLAIDGKDLLDNDSTRDFTRAFTAPIQLSAGKHPFRIVLANQDECLVLGYEGPGMAMRNLSMPLSERIPKPIPPYEYVLEGEPAYQRGFVMHRGVVNPYAMAVGIPGGVNYAYDLNRYTLLSAWHGRYIDVSNMWTERGETQEAKPLGTPVSFVAKPALVQLSNPHQSWPDTMAVDDNLYINRGYSINENGLPVFNYTLSAVQVTDLLLPTADGAGLERRLAFTGTSSIKDLYFLLASGKQIELLPNGNYAVDDKQFYIEALKGIAAKNLLLVKNDGQQQLLLPLAALNPAAPQIAYSLIW